MPETMFRYENGNGENLTPTTPRSSPIIVPRTKPKPKPQLVSRRIAPATISDSDTTHTHYYKAVEKHLPNGDLYIGGFHNNSPHGSGKYLWSDGCMYEGDWDNGVATGKGKFSWPSGATYQGQFKSGRMEGAGTFIGADGDSYIGSWCADKKHGFGAKHYCNGDYYEGQWKNNLQEGQGWYVWKNGNEYVGEWRNGVIHGRGVFVWRNGLKYDGNWDNGAPKAPGFFSWSNDVCKNNAHGITQDVKGFFGQKLSELESDHKRSLFVEDDNYEAVPRICIWESDGEAGDITCDIIDAGFAGYRDDREVKRPGQTISKGHKNYDLMLNLQLGIRHSVGKHASIRRSLKTSDFDPKEKFWTRFPPEGSKITPPHQSVEFRWKDYCPVVFRHLRDLFRVDPADYMLAICGNDALRELSSPGKSGSFFYLTQDDRFMIKTLKKSEVKALLKMLPSYYQHVCRYKNSLVTKFYSVHCVKPVGGLKTRFIVMGNMFCSAFRIHRRFDLKGSSHGRITDKPKEEIDETTTLKDLDLDFVFRLQSKWFQELMKQIDLDCGFLESEGIMDYSLLVGVHFRDDSVPFAMQTGTYDSYKLQGMDRVSPDRKPLMRVGANMPARATRGGNDDSIYEVVLYMGIIDILQDYDISKKLEHAYKSLQVDPASISAVDPKLYSRRFQDFVTRIFIGDTNT